MKALMNNKLTVVLTILTILLAIATFSSYSIAYRNKIARDREMMTRLELEERINQLAGQPCPSQDEIVKLQGQIAEERTAHEATKTSLVQEQISNQGLREEVERLASKTSVLEGQLQEALSVEE